MKNIKKSAGIILKNNWSSAIIAVIVPCVFMLITTGFELIIRRFFYPFYLAKSREYLILLTSLILFAIFVYPLKIGKKYCFYQNITTRKIESGDVFYCYSDLKIFLLSTTTVLVKNAVKIIFFLITVSPVLSLLKISFEKNFAAYYQIMIALSLGAVLFFNIVLSYSLFLTEYIMIKTHKNPFYSVVLSVKKMRKHRCRLLTFQLKFIPCFLSCIAVFPILYAAPLYSQSAALFANDIICGDCPCSPTYPLVSSADT